ncbi:MULTISPECIES: hypothetical protein [Pseudolactococcus]|jgi:hypothetical protein|uniref:hypothetical protein n=1 Tax=Pseudolactococcus TaxID=3436058 RepID=UPI000A8139D3|nr:MULTISPECIES: hypothetical protein [Lactococcus]MBR6895726.1 hypothetical protein [Lactococcus sp.]MCJ1970398.1 hypothetical protein [Lactococcus carnosus]MCJ1996878.1 hypothetical protein [Lactococcus carnosus]
MKQLTVSETQEILGGVSWECLACPFKSANHVFTATASQRAYEHESRYGHYGKTRIR